MNALYHAESSQLLLQMAVEHEVPLLFITNNVCNKLLRFENVTEIAQVSVRPRSLRIAAPSFVSAFLGCGWLSWCSWPHE